MPDNTLYSHTWYAEQYDEEKFGGAFGRCLQRQEVALVRSLLDGVQGTTLDVGAGTGKLSLALMRDGREVVAVDSSIRMLQVADKKAADEGMMVTAIICDAQHLCFQTRSFQCAVSSRILMHLDDWQRGLAELCRVAETLIVDFPPVVSFGGLDSLLKRHRLPLLVNAQPYRAFRILSVIDELRKHSFEIVALHRAFVLPLAFHRWLDRPQLSLNIEKLCRRIGLSSILGAPVTIKAVKGDERENG